MPGIRIESVVPVLPFSGLRKLLDGDRKGALEHSSRRCLYVANAKIISCGQLWPQGAVRCVTAGMVVRQYLLGAAGQDKNALS